MKALLLFSASLFACSLSTLDKEEGNCKIAGTYIISSSSDANKTPTCDSAPALMVITPNGDKTYAVSVSGLNGGCTASTTDVCEISLSCYIFGHGNDGTFQGVYSFTNNGFEGFQKFEIRISPTFPNGCDDVGPVSGVRQ